MPHGEVIFKVNKEILNLFILGSSGSEQAVARDVHDKHHYFPVLMDLDKNLAIIR